MTGPGGTHRVTPTPSPAERVVRSPSVDWRQVPGAPRLLVASTAGRTATAVRGLAGATDWRRELLDRIAVRTVSLFGARRLPPVANAPWPGDALGAVLDELRRGLHGFRLLGATVPRQRGRHRLSLLLRTTGNLAVVKVGAADAGLAREACALDLLATRPLPGIATPVPLAFGTVGDGPDTLAYLVTSAVAVRHQRPAIDVPLRTFEDDLAARLADLPREPSVVRPDQIPLHGDLTPWNLRRTPRGLALFDWEAAGWGQAGSDLAHYRAACSELRPPWRRAPA